MPKPEQKKRPVAEPDEEKKQPAQKPVAVQPKQKVPEKKVDEKVLPGKKKDDTHEIVEYEWKSGRFLDESDNDEESDAEESTEYTSEQDDFGEDGDDKSGDDEGDGDDGDEDDGDEDEDDDDESDDESDDEDGEDEDDDDESDDEDEEDEDENDDEGEFLTRKPVNPGSKSESTTVVNKTVVNESDSSEEEVENRVGDIPMWWYDEYGHIGYNVDGQKIARKTNKMDKLDEFMQQQDKDNLRNVYDEVNDKIVRLTDEEMEMIRRIQKGQVADPSFDPYEEIGLIYDRSDQIHPLTSAYEPKRRFIPSKWEAKAIVKLVRAIRKGYIKPKTSAKDKKPKFYDIWKDSDSSSKGRGSDMPAPKVKPPGHNESYNPPEEYLPTPQEAEAWLKAHPEDRETNFLPKRYGALRHVPAYSNFIKERFERCLDLYLCPRAVQKKATIDPESLIPKLPSPSELKPFPSEVVLEFIGHTEKVRSVSVDPTGQYLLSGSDDNTARVWEISTGRCCFVYQATGVIQKVAWSPSTAVNVIALASVSDIILLNPSVGNMEVVQYTNEIYTQKFDTAGNEERTGMVWRKPSSSEYKKGVLATITHPKDISYMSWHAKGDYLATVCSDPSSTIVSIHHVQKFASQIPFRKNKEPVQCIRFHPTKPQFFVATQRTVSLYDLMKQRLIKKMTCGVQWISSIDVHPGGDNFIVGSYDRRVVWMDLDFASRPYKIMRNHFMAVRQVMYHKKYPLFASCSDDCAVHVFHNTVYDDLSKNALIVPLKILRGHKKTDDLGILDFVFHPTQPWIITAGADTTIKLYA